MSLLLLFAAPPPTQSQDDDRGGSSRRRPHTAVYASASVRLIRATSAAFGASSTPTVLQIRGLASVITGSTLLVRLALSTPVAAARRRTFATSMTNRAARPLLAGGATGSVWTQRDEETELFLLGLFS